MGLGNFNNSYPRPQNSVHRPTISHSDLVYLTPTSNRFEVADVLMEIVSVLLGNRRNPQSYQYLPEKVTKIDILQAMAECFVTVQKPNSDYRGN